MDAGGGTIDTTVHRYNSDKLLEIHTPSGGKWGSSYIDAQFEEFLEELFGKEHVMMLKNSSDWYEVMDNFEVLRVRGG